MVTTDDLDLIDSADTDGVAEHFASNPECEALLLRYDGHDDMFAVMARDGRIAGVIHTSVTPFLADVACLSYRPGDRTTTIRSRDGESVVDFLTRVTLAIFERTYHRDARR